MKDDDFKAYFTNGVTPHVSWLSLDPAHPLYGATLFRSSAPSLTRGSFTKYTEALLHADSSQLGAHLAYLDFLDRASASLDSLFLSPQNSDSSPRHRPLKIVSTGMKRSNVAEIHPPTSVHFLNLPIAELEERYADDLVR